MKWQAVRWNVISLALLGSMLVVIALWAASTFGVDLHAGVQVAMIVITGQVAVMANLARPAAGASVPLSALQPASGGNEATVTVVRTNVLTLAVIAVFILLLIALVTRDGKAVIDLAIILATGFVARMKDMTEPDSEPLVPLSSLPAVNAARSRESGS